MHSPSNAPLNSQAAVDFREAVEQMRRAAAAFINGDTGPWNAICSHREDATLCGGWGGHERGWAELEPRYAWAAARFAGGEVTFEDLAQDVSGDLGHTVWIERSQARLRGVDGTASVALRVTHIYRREDGSWKMVHRHADPIVSIQGTASVVER